MASEGLLGFIKGVSGTLEEEYKRQNLEAEDIRKESRAEERAIAAEQRRLIAEKQVAEYRKKLDLQFAPQMAEAEAATERGLIARGEHPDLLLGRAKTEQEVELINKGMDPASARIEYQDMSEAGRIRAGLGAESARLAAGTDAEKTKAEEKARLEALREDDRIRAEEGLLARGRQEVGVSFTISEATDQLRNDLSAIHGIDLSATRTRMSDIAKGGSRISDLRSGEVPLTEILADPENREELRAEIAYKIHNEEVKRLKEAAKQKQVTSLDQVTPLSDMIAERADQTITALEKAQQMISSGQESTQVASQLRASLAKAYGEPEEEDKQSTGFRSMWAAFNHSLTK